MKCGRATFWSTSRQEIWTKGETTGNSLSIDQVLVDCDQDAIVYKVTLEKGGMPHGFFLWRTQESLVLQKIWRRGQT
ncbi:phosphoribosyl-AMP cyclohydrolase [Sphingobacterium micropteri]|uniref:phosphoribosyl-AMP cyclohydrolase n=1 Tax=Sphingobacterium micropteri TaxID=2763501 RepID=UPI001CC29CA9|nr:phosphoribosyl-AMP cyclohydrolase [Sphingobacterium micropteri]